MPLIQFPNVPALPGVPAIVRSLTVPTSLTGLFGFAQNLLSDLFGGQWGIYDDNGAIALIPDSFVGVNFRNDERQSDYPVEQGQFESYNKVQTPYDCRVKMAIGADIVSRTAFLVQCDSMLKSTNLYTVITPEASYASASLVNYLYARSERSGATLIQVELWFQEVRNTAVTLTAETQQPDGATTVSDGQVQAFSVPNPPTLTAQPIQ